MRSILVLGLVWFLASAPALAQSPEAEPPPDGSVASDPNENPGVDEPNLEPPLEEAGSAASPEEGSVGSDSDEIRASESTSPDEGGSDEEELQPEASALDFTGEAPPPPREIIVEEREEEPPSLEVRFTDERVAGWVVFGSSLLVAIGGGITLAAGLDELNAVENAPFGSDWERFEGAYERAPLLTAVGATVLGFGFAGLVVGSILLSESGPDGAWIRAALGPGRVALEGRF